MCTVGVHLAAVEHVEDLPEHKHVEDNGVVEAALLHKQVGTEDVLAQIQQREDQAKLFVGEHKNK